MEQTLLLTLRGDDFMRTLVFDERVQSVVWVGREQSPSPTDAYVCVERKGEGLVVRAASSDVKLRLAGHTRGDVTSVAIERGAQTMLGLCVDNGERPLVLHIRPSGKGMRTFRRMCVGSDFSLVVGRDASADVSYENRFVSGSHARLSSVNGELAIEDLGSGNATCVNAKPIRSRHPRALEAGDVVQVLDWTFMVGRGFISTNQPLGIDLTTLSNTYRPGSDSGCQYVSVDAPQVRPEPFLPAPRIMSTIRAPQLDIEAPPNRVEATEQSALVRLGPSVLMGMGSVAMAASVASNVARGADALASLPMLTMAIAMVLGSMVWPMISRSHDRKKAERTEHLRRQRYVSYLDQVENTLLQEVSKQSEVLVQSLPPIDQMLALAQEASPLLMSHAPTHPDFLRVRVGVGDVELDADIAWPERPFSLGDDELWGRLDELERNPPTLRGVPVALDLASHPVVGVVGDRRLAWEFMRGIIVQLCASYSYEELKIALIVGQQEREDWAPFSFLRHTWTTDGESRLVAFSDSGVARLDQLLESLCLGRIDDDVDATRRAHVLVVCGDARIAERSAVVRKMAHLQKEARATLVFLGTGLAQLPKTCDFLVDLTEGGVCQTAATRDDTDRSHATVMRHARMFSRADVTGTLCEFDPDGMVTRQQARAFCLAMARVHVDEGPTRQSSVHALGFLELFGVGNVAHLNVGKRWTEHDGSRTLRTPLGVDDQGSLLWLDLHEDGEGPHGLVAGTTGSGKSELIVTLVLSLATNYAPDEVEFLLIDYKGGGLAGAFADGRHRLPHLCGTITNLDGAGIHRSLVSLRSELRRRQRMLNEARAITGETTMDIYRYVRLYRQGVLNDPLPHLVVVADEFAELKQQEPAFMDELMTAARIGRSLGVHLILATQKPTGVVNDQIWSNARFKICLKVADAADSREMLRTDDAATLQRPGQFRLLVGYADAYVGGQAAYAGCPYVERISAQPRRDTRVDLLDHDGTVLESTELRMEACASQESELAAVLGQLEQTARALGTRTRRLWIDPLPPHLTLDELDRRCAAREVSGLTCSIGLIDDPWNQDQRRLDVDLRDVGNLLFYGAQNSGVEELLRTVMVSLARHKEPHRLWLYGVDYGQGKLASLEQVPHWGATVRMGQEERMEGLLRLLEREVSERKQSSLGVSDAKAVPIVVALANLLAWTEANPRLEERLESLTREGPACGIHVIATAQSVLTTRMRLRSNFGMELPTVLNDAGEYALLLGSMQEAIVPKQPMRGLVSSRGHLLEWQGARLSDEEQDVGAWLASAFPESSAPVVGGAPTIPSVPQRVEAYAMACHASAHRFPVGMTRIEAEVVCVDVRSHSPLLVTGNSADGIASYVRGACQALEAGETSVCLVSMRMDRDEAERAIRQVVEGQSDCQVVVLDGASAIMERLEPQTAAALKQALIGMVPDVKPGFVVAMESWRMSSVYEEWLRSLVMAGRGVWVGTGFAQQTVFPLVDARPPTHGTPDSSDGVLVDHGVIRAVRLVQPSEVTGEGEAHGA